MSSIAPRAAALVAQAVPLANALNLRAAPVIATPAGLHRPFFLAAIAMTLTLGVTWGAILLWRIGVAESFTAISVHTINAHGEAQIYGWVGLFIMGFASQVFPRMWRSTPINVRVTYIALGLTVIGIVTRAVGLQLHGVSSMAMPIAVAGGSLNVVGIAIFCVQMLSAFKHRRTESEPAFLFMLVAIGWMALSSVFSLVHTWLTMAAIDPDSLVRTVADYQAALRDVQIHGMALTMILGVSIKMLPSMFGVTPISNNRAIAALACITVAVAGETGLFIAYRMTGLPAVGAAMYACWVLLAIGVGMILVKWTPCLGLPRDDGRSGKFVRVAFVWLAISLLMLLALPAYQAISGKAFSHAYFGAARHAVTVGFVSMMIMGIAGRVVPSLSGRSMAGLSSLLGPFVLINIGCLLRVTLQVATDFNSLAFAAVGISSILELAGIVWWACDLVPHLGRTRNGVQDPILVPLTVLESSCIKAPSKAPSSCCSACSAPSPHEHRTPPR